MISIKNTQRSIFFSVKIFQEKAQSILNYLNYNDFDLGIWLTTDKTIKKFNNQFRGKDKPTDILSFPYHPNLKAGKRIVIKEKEDKNLGDLIISLNYVHKNKHNLDGSFQDRMDRMLVHGICHLLGYDHISDYDFKKMNTLENELLSIISKNHKPDTSVQ